jgi:hypothetical protein
LLCLLFWLLLFCISSGWCGCFAFQLVDCCVLFVYDGFGYWWFKRGLLRPWGMWRMPARSSKYPRSEGRESIAKSFQTNQLADHFSPWYFVSPSSTMYSIRQSDGVGGWRGAFGSRWQMSRWET